MGIDAGISNFTIPTMAYVGAAFLAVGFGLLFLIAKGLTGGRMMRVPEGTPVDKYFRDWRNAALSKKIGRAAIFIAFLAIGLMLGGCGAVVIGFVTQ